MQPIYEDLIKMWKENGFDYEIYLLPLRNTQIAPIILILILKHGKKPPKE